MSSPTDSTRRTALVLLAAGAGRRSGHQTNKVLLPLAGRRVFTWSIRAARALPEVSRVVLVIRESDRDEIEAVLAHEVPEGGVTVVVGGASRHASEWAALQVLAPAVRDGEIDVVVIHDAARPLAGTGLFRTAIETAATHGGALPVREQPDLIARDGAGAAPGRVVAVQTPQAFRAAPLLAAYAEAAAEGFEGTDTASCVERYTDVALVCVPGHAGNVKITFPQDLRLAERLLARIEPGPGGLSDPSRRGGRDPRVTATGTPTG